MGCNTNGFFPLAKQIQAHWLWQDKPFSRGQAWIDLLMMANYDTGKIMSKGILVTVERGQVFRTISFLSNRWGWNPKKTRAFLKTLENEKMVHTEGLTNGTLITIENYTKWNDEGQTEVQAEGHSRGEPGVSLGSQKKKNKKNKKNINNISSNKLSDEFDELWEIYPRKEGKKKAKDAYIRARKNGTSFEEVMNGIRSYQNHIEQTGMDRKYIKMGSTYFNGRCWEDRFEVTESVDDILARWGNDN